MAGRRLADERSCPERFVRIEWPLKHRKSQMARDLVDE